MHLLRRWIPPFLCLCLALAATPAPAQETPEGPHQQVISANPFGLLLEFFNAEYERTVSGSSTLGVGARTFRATRTTT